MITAEQERLKSQNEHDTGTPVAQWIHDGMSINREQVLAIALLQNYREHPLQETWETITQMCDSLNLKLKKFRERQQEIHPHLTLSTLDVDEPELTAIQLPSYRMRRGHCPVTDLDQQLQDVEIKLHCMAADSGIAAVQDASLVLSTVRKRNLQKAELMKEFEISMTAWYLQSGVTISEAAFSSAQPPVAGSQSSEDEELQLLSGTKTLKRSDMVLSDSKDSDLDLPHSKSLSQQKKAKKAKRADGWIWLQGLTQAQYMNGDKLAAYRSEKISPRQCGMGQTCECRGDAERGLNGAVTFTQMQAVMHWRLEHNANVIFKSTDSGAHHDWVSASSFEDPINKIDGWHNMVFKWMDNMGIHTAYKDF
ncbi:hypothetical protein C8J57DRAFT_1574424 [Mycena rebaudengoi]|nr:hypothetical protein C8J57DRAFT_1574424 [Mycena rebaudengoi]